MTGTGGDTGDSGTGGYTGDSGGMILAVIPVMVVILRLIYLMLSLLTVMVLFYPTACPREYGQVLVVILVILVW